MPEFHQPMIVVETDEYGLAKRMLIDGLVVEHFHNLTVNLDPNQRTTVTVTIPCQAIIRAKHVSLAEVETRAERAHLRDAGR